MAVYEPRLDWLREQLLSLNAQTYPNLVLYVRDDCSSQVPYNDICACLKDCITAFPYTIQRNEKNLGSNRTFERLTREAEGDYFAYCDQDDIWLPDKLAILKHTIIESGALLACSDMYIIDSNGEQVACSIKQVRRHHVFHSGEGLAKGLLFHNFVTGCTMLVRSKEAKDAVPFCPYMVHDHYLALWCAQKGRIESIFTPLIYYRIHGGNQTGLLSGVVDKESYGNVRIDAALKKFQWLAGHFPCDNALREVLAQACVWANARQENWNSGRCKKIVWKYRSFSILPSIFELFAEKFPEWLFHQCLMLGKRNMV